VCIGRRLQLWLSSRYQIWQFEQRPAAVLYSPATTAATVGDESPPLPEWVGRGYDVISIPRVGYTTGHIALRDKRRDGDCVLDVVTEEAVCKGLSMPAPWHEPAPVSQPTRVLVRHGQIPNGLNRGAIPSLIACSAACG